MLRFLPLCVLLIAAAHATVKPQQTGPCACDTPTNRGALTALYFNTSGPTWTNNYGWATAAPVCLWSRVTCIDANVWQINLSSNNLNGTLPDAVSALTALQYLLLYNNQLTGTLPDSWSAMTALRDLDLSSNQLTGTLPDSWSAMTAMQDLDLSSNQLTGTLPDSWSAMTALHYLRLASNQLTGPVDLCGMGWGPLFLGSGSNLTDNKFAGYFNCSCFDVPNSCSMLHKDVFEGNSFCGCVACSLPACSATTKAPRGRHVVHRHPVQNPTQGTERVE
jgi:hypothetical protein